MDYLTIGDPDKFENGWNKCKAMRGFIKNSIEYFAKMIEYPENMAVKFIKSFIEKARIALTNNKNSDCLLDLSTLFGAKEEKEADEALLQLHEINYYKKCLRYKPMNIDTDNR